MGSLSDLAIAWGSSYANHAALRTCVTFAHVAALIVGGGAAVTADRATLRAARDGGGAVLDALFEAHRVVLWSLLAVGISGLLMFAADLDTLLYSRVFWIKMGLVALLLVNGGVLWSAERNARRHDASAWRTLKVTAAASLSLWLLAALAGVALLNIG